MVTRDMLKVLTAFHHWQTRRITGMTAKGGVGREWEYPAVEDVIYSTGIQPIGVYIKRQQILISERVACRSVYILCMEVNRMLGTIRMVYWWDL